jgi:dTDP-4-dehydrorhamnose reductase
LATKLLFTGSSSLVGSHFVEKFGRKYEISAIGKRNLFQDKGPLASFSAVDFTDGEALDKAVEESDARIVVNYAARTDVDGCELERGNIGGSVYSVNTTAAKRIAECCQRTGKRMYQISTDMVFDGTSGPYGEKDAPGPATKPIGWYAHTKYLAEQEVEKACKEHCILRIAYPYRANFAPKLDFARSILDQHRRGKLHPMFTDQLFTPTLVDDASTALDLLISKRVEGVVHVASKNVTTPYEFATKLLSAFFSYSQPLQKGSVLEFNSSPGRAPRPVRGGLRTDRISALGLVPRTTDEGIAEILRQSRL